MSSLIIEDKNALDSLANAIIGANGSVDKTSATKDELIDIINGIIPLKSKFASGIFTPTENITTKNSPRINFALGNDENGIPIKPNVIIAYQPFALTDPTPVNATCYRIYSYGTALAYPVDHPTMTLWNFSIYRKLEPSSGGALYTGGSQNASYVTDIEDDAYIFDKIGFKLQPNNDNYPFLASHPIVWLQIKFEDENVTK